MRKKNYSSNYLCFILLPATFLYRAIIFFRKIFYKYHIFRTNALPCKVISVGNITVGGSGKTPTVEYISRHLQSRGKKIGIISSSQYNENTNSAILDTMMKEPTFNLPGLMTVIEKVYLRWMFDELNLSKITGFLFSDNKKMMNIHEKCGWVIIDVVPIQKISIGGNTKWEKIATKSDNIDVERHFNLIELTKENLMKNFDCIEYQFLGD